MDDLFAPPGAGWRRVSPRLRVVRRAFLLCFAVVLLAVGLVGWVLLDAPPAWLLPVGLVVWAAGLAAGWWWTDRSVRRWGYAEQEGELWITSGAMFRRFVVVPYGRMQFVDVQAGPFDQLAGIAQVQMHTASPGTTAVIPGLEREEAARLRDRLTALGESEAAGL